MLKKIWIIILLSITWFSSSFAYKIDNLEYLYNKKLDKVEKNIETKYKENSKICYYKKEKYNKLNKVLTLYKNKYPKYVNIFDILIKTNTYRCNKIKKQCNSEISEHKKQTVSENKRKYQKINSENTWEWEKISNQVENKDKQDDKLTSKLWKINYNYNWDIDIKKTYYKIKLPAIWSIDNVYNDFIVEINNNWIGFQKIITIEVPANELEYGIDYAKKNYNKDYIFYKKENDKYKLWLINKEHINIIKPFNPKKSIDYNIDKLKEDWHIYIEKFFYSKTDKNNIVTSWLFKYNDKLYYLSLAWTWRYYKIPKKDFIKYIKNIKEWTIITNSENALIAWKDGIKIFYLWDFSIYKDIDLEKLWKILNFTFYTIWKYNLQYSVENMYNLLNFAKQFEWKTLEELYKWIISNITYNEKVNNMLNQEWFSQKILNNKINIDKELIKNWNIFESLKNKEWVCQSISDIYSIIALFNWKQADTVVWISNRWYLHQVSKIWDYYYDPTYDLENTKKMKYFKMSKKELEKYFNIIEN